MSLAYSYNGEDSDSEDSDDVMTVNRIVIPYIQVMIVIRADQVAQTQQKSTRGESRSTFKLTVGA